MHRSVTTILLQMIAGIWVLCSFARAQPPLNNCSISFISNKDGLSQLTNFSMLQDSRGYMWIGSQDGINRYNGKSFYHFTDSFFFENCKAPKQIFGLIEDPNGNIWMGSREALFQYRHQSHTFRKIHVPLQKSSSDNKVMPFALAGKEIWFVKDDLSFMAIDCSTLKVRPLFTMNEPLKSVGAFLLMPQLGHHGIIWMGNGNQLLEINTVKGILTKHTITGQDINNVSDISIKGISFHPSSGMLAIATDKGPVLFDTRLHRIRTVNDPEKLVLGQDTWYVKAADDCFWVSNDKSHLIKMSLEGKQIQAILEKSVLDNETHRGTATVCIYTDKWKRLWLNATGEYIAVIDLGGHFIKKVIKGKKNGFRSGTMAGIAVTDSVVWASDTYLNKIERATGKVQQIFSVNEGLKTEGAFLQLYFDSVVNRLWFNTSKGLYYLSLSDERFVKTSFNRPGSTSVDYVRNFISMPGGQLLMVRTDGVFEIDRKDGSGRLKDGFPGGGINHLCKLSGNRFALSLSGQPLHIYDFAHGTDVRFNQKIPQVHSLMMVAEDSVHGIIWAASEEGLYKLHNKTFKVLKHFTIQDGMSNDFVYAALPDAYGWVWCSTNKGIVAINGANHAILNFDKEDYLQDLEFNNRSFYKDKDGYIYFGGVKGLNYFKPPFIDHDTVKPKLVIETISLNDKPYSTSINPDYLTELAFDYAAVPLNIKAHALHLVKAASLKVIYRISGQQKWSEVHNGGYISLFNLSPGTYVLEINYREGNSQSTSGRRKITIIVNPPFYSTWWFILGVTTLALLLVMYAVGRKQKRKLEKLQSEHEIMKLRADRQLAVARERERIIADLHDDIGATLSSMNIYSELANEVMSEKPEEGKSLVNKISGISRELMGRMSDIIWSMKPGDEEKYTLEARLKNYCSELLSPKNIHFDLDIDPQAAASVKQPEFRKNILLIALEAVNNIAKYSGASEVDISFKEVDGVRQLLIRDDGQGFDPASVQGGNGLTNIRQRCRQLGGECTIQSSPGKGVRVCCTFI